PRRLASARISSWCSFTRSTVTGRASWAIGRLRTHNDVPESGRCRQRSLVKVARECSGSRSPEIGMYSHCKVRDGRWVPTDSLVDNLAIYKPDDAVVSPVDAVPVEAFAGVETKVDPIGRAAVAITHSRAVVARVEEHVDQHLPGITSRELNIDLLPRGGSVKEEARD